MKTYDLFPTLVGSEQYKDHAQFKKIFFNNLPKYAREDGVTGEASGHVDLHLNPDFEDFFRFISVVANDYIKTLVGSKDIWEPWLVKTWFSDFSVPLHDHADAHLSFVYYVNVPENQASPLHFIPPIDRMNDLTNGMFLLNRDVDVVSQYNNYNCSSVAFTPQEGMVLIFPARLKHVVETNLNKELDDIRQRRISIAGDFILTFKEATTRSMGLQPLRNWRSMNG